MNRTPSVRRRMTVGVFQGSGPCGPMVKATVNRRTPVRSRENPSQSKRRRANLFLARPGTSGLVSISVRGLASALSWLSFGSTTSGTKTQDNTETIAYNPDRHTKGALQLIFSAKPPDPRPPIIVAAGVPIRNDEKTIFFRRDGVGYVRLRMPTANGILAAEAIPARLEMTSRTTPVLEKDVRATSREKTTRLATRRVLRGRDGHVSAIWPKGRRNDPVVSLLD